MNIYLACPYTHEDPEVMLKRYNQVTAKAGELMIAGHTVFSPISHSHPIAQKLPDRYITDFGFWMNQDADYIKRWADELRVLCLDGWSLSKGVLHEIAVAHKMNLPVRLLKGYA